MGKYSVPYPRVLSRQVLLEEGGLIPLSLDSGEAVSIRPFSELFTAYYSIAKEIEDNLVRHFALASTPLQCKLTVDKDFASCMEVHVRMANIDRSIMSCSQ